MGRRGIGGVRIGNRRIWTIGYADDIVTLAYGEEAMTEQLQQLREYFRKKEMTLSAEKTKMMVYRAGRGRKRKRKWMWGRQEIEEVKEFTYLEYKVQENNGDDKHIKDRASKANAVVGRVWSIAERRFS